ncbi:unnamed protein product [Phytophthora fragariaefolia]|uniref:Unnamed protein product n=1 Tax=Phytophthora fragariaefolia TaxID=1490495 RepID=A0A9W6XYZ9_9STRA|nr:unnamed protein product [Phytophthora fragariaefolia]
MAVHGASEERDQVWLFMERVKPGLTKKLAHRWHGPFRVKRKVEKFAYELELPDKSGYRSYPVVHVSRLEAVKELGERPTTRLRPELSEAERFDFDEEPPGKITGNQMRTTTDLKSKPSSTTSFHYQLAHLELDEGSRSNESATMSRTSSLPLSNLSRGRCADRLPTDQEARKPPANGVGGERELVAPCHMLPRLNEYCRPSRMELLLQ